MAKEKKMLDKQVVAIWTVVVLLFGTVVLLIGFAFFRMHYVKNYMRQCGVNFTGDVDVYADVEGQYYSISHDISGNIGRTIIIGAINLKRMKNKPTGNQIIFTTIDNQTGIKRKATIDELSNARVMVTIENENGKKRVVLDDITYLSISRLITTNVEDGKNAIVDAIP